MDRNSVLRGFDSHSSQPRAILLHLVEFAIGIGWAEAKEAFKHPTTPGIGPTVKTSVAPRVHIWQKLRTLVRTSDGKTEDPAVQLITWCEEVKSRALWRYRA